METLYKITNKTNGKYYIGSTTNFETRLEQHWSEYEHIRKRCCPELYKDLEELPKNFFEYEILFQSNDKVEVSRMESKLIREAKNDPLIYNISLGASGRRVLEQKDIVFIRELYNEKKMYITEAYNKYYKDVITFRAFKKAWHGDTFKDIHYHVYTKENKSWHFSKGQSRPGETNGCSIFTEKQVIEIRCRRDNGESMKDVFKDYPFVQLPCFRSIWNNKTWKYLL